MLRFLASLIVSIGGLALLATGVLGPLTPSEGFPSIENIAIYAVLPLAMIAVSITYTTSTIFKALLSIVLIGAIGLLGYVFLGMVAQ